MIPRKAYQKSKGWEAAACNKCEMEYQTLTMVKIQLLTSYVVLG